MTATSSPAEPPELAEGAEGRSLNDLLAERFHDTYERLAPDYGYETRDESAAPWAEVPERNRALMRAVVAELREGGYITVPYPGSRAADTPGWTCSRGKGWS